MKLGEFAKLVSKLRGLQIRLERERRQQPHTGHLQLVADCKHAAAAVDRALELIAFQTPALPGMGDDAPPPAIEDLDRPPHAKYAM